MASCSQRQKRERQRDRERERREERGGTGEEGEGRTAIVGEEEGGGVPRDEAQHRLRSWEEITTKVYHIAATEAEG
jgi:hypothetical protein